GIAARGHRPALAGHSRPDHRPHLPARGNVLRGACGARGTGLAFLPELAPRATLGGHGDGRRYLRLHGRSAVLDPRRERIAPRLESSLGTPTAQAAPREVPRLNWHLACGSVIVRPCCSGLPACLPCSPSWPPLR